jgi:hypothetical protein
VSALRRTPIVARLTNHACFRLKELTEQEKLRCLFSQFTTALQGFPAMDLVSPAAHYLQQAQAGR